MDFRNANSGSQPWGSYQQRSGPETPVNVGYQLNPAVPGFQPTGTEMQRYQQFPPTPPFGNAGTPRDMMQLHDHVLSSHFLHTKDITWLQGENQKTIEEVQEIRNAVGRDIRTLQSEIKALKEHASATERKDRSSDQSSRTQRGLGQVSDDFSQESIAERYLDEAKIMEATATKLREQASQLLGRDTKLVTMKLLEGPTDLGNQADMKAEFACCGDTYGSVQVLLDHVHSSHSSPVEQSTDIHDTTNESTPTHVPARRPKPTEAADSNHAESAEEQKLKAEISELKLELAKKDPLKRLDTKDESVESNRPVAVAAPTSSDEDWVPLAVRQMPKIPPLNVENNIETFTWEFLNLTFRGEQWSPGFYFIAKNSPLPSKSYWVLEAEYEPCLPKAPGRHGAKLTAFFNETESATGQAPDVTNYLNVPVFVCPEGKKEYVYFGNFSQKRFSDKLDYDHVTGTVPSMIRRYWAEQLSELGRPEWVTRALIEHFWPKPIYYGPIPTDSALATPATAETPQTNMSDVLEKRVVDALHEYADELKDWKKDTEMKVRHLTVENLMAAFERADADEEPGLRLWWEYMEFVNYDQEFYNFLISMKSLQKPQKSSTRRTPTPKATTTQPTSDDETVKPASPAKLKPSKHAASVPTWTTGTKNHTNSVKPWEQMSTAATTSSRVADGDVEAAKAFQAGMAKNYAPGAGRMGDGKKVPPHMRRGK